MDEAVRRPEQAVRREEDVVRPEGEVRSPIFSFHIPILFCLELSSELTKAGFELMHHCRQLNKLLGGKFV